MYQCDLMIALDRTTNKAFFDFDLMNSTQAQQSYKIPIPNTNQIVATLCSAYHVAPSFLETIC